MALMDAGIPLQHVAGVSVGLVSEVDPSTGEIKDYRILTDILGLEDHLGDMDFKIAGTRIGVTAIQLDIKPAGIPLDIICECLEHAHKGRLQILDHMEREISAPRTQDDRNSPRLATLKYDNDTLRRLIGPLGALKRKIEEETGGRISVSDGTLTVVAKNQSVMEKVLEKVDFIIGREIEVGGIYKGVVTSVKEYGAFVEFNGGQQGLLHVSELSHEPVSRVSDVVSVGQQLSLRCIGQDVRGNIKLSLKAVSPRPEADVKGVVEGSVPVNKQATDVWASVGDVSNGQNPELPMRKNETPGVNSSTSSTPAVLIRSAAECDEEEKASGFSQSSKSTLKSTLASKSNSKPKKFTSQSDFFSSTNIQKSTSFSQREREELAECLFGTEDGDEDNKGTRVEAIVSAKNLKLGTKVAAKVYQVRARGLVLDLGGGIRGMYRFENNEKKDFVVGDELLVKCSSFTGKGIPVVSLVDS